MKASTLISGFTRVNYVAAPVLLPWANGPGGKGGLPPWLLHGSARRTGYIETTMERKRDEVHVCIIWYGMYDKTG